jgi:fatty acid synthase
MYCQTGMAVYKYKNLNVVKCHGVELRGLKASLAPRRQQTQASPQLEEYTFTPYFDEKSPVSMNTPSKKALRVCVDLVIENTPALKLKVAEICQNACDSLATEVHNIAMAQPMYQDEVIILTLKSESAKLEEAAKAGIKIVAKDSVEKLVPEQGAHLVVVDDETLLPAVADSLKEMSFVLVQLPMDKATKVSHPTLELVAHKVSKDRQFFLLKKVRQSGNHTSNLRKKFLLWTVLLTYVCVFIF